MLVTTLGSVGRGGGVFASGGRYGAAKGERENLRTPVDAAPLVCC
jgi:hypothetical protein